jgi:hypothetical protein
MEPTFGHQRRFYPDLTIIPCRHAAIASKGGEPIPGRDLIALLATIGMSAISTCETDLAS